MQFIMDLFESLFFRDASCGILGYIDDFFKLYSWSFLKQGSGLHNNSWYGMVRMRLDVGWCGRLGWVRVG